MYNLQVHNLAKEVEVFLGIDIGGTSVRIGAFENLDSTEPFASDSFKVSRDYQADFDRLQKACSLIRPHELLVEGIGIAIAGVIEKDRTTLSRAGNTAQWVGQPFRQVLGGVFNCPVVLGNDAEAAAMAEAVYGNPAGDDFWFVIWGTGVGGTLVRHVDGKPLAFPGEMGHIKVKGSGLNERTCACGQTDCLEAYCGGDMIRQYDGIPAEDLDPGKWIVILNQMMVGLRAVVTSQPVEYVYFSGGIASKQAAFVLPWLEKRLREELRIVDAPQLHLSRFGEGAGTVGALAMLKSSLA